ncbi:MFS transporter [Pontiellaceae bacterium B1224]|nr:MFS transporter [Pontiellaceae bacterium B1224]
MQSPKSITEEQIRTSLNNSIIAGAVGVFFFMIIQNGPIPLMLEKLGASGIAIGLTATLFQLGMMVQIPAAFFAERLARRKSFWAYTSGIARAAMAIPGLYLLLAPENPSPAVWITLACIGFFSFLSQCGGPVWFGWMADLIPEDKRAGFWARRQGVCMIVCVVSVALTGWFLDLFGESTLAGFGWLLIFASVMGVSDVILHWFVLEPEPAPSNRSLSPAKRIFQPLENRDFLFFTLAMCVWFFGLGFFAPFMNVYLKSTFDVTYTHLSAIQLSGMISSVISSFVGGYLINRMGLRSFGLAMVVTIPLFSVAWFFLDGNATGLLPIIGIVPQPVMILCISSLIAGGVYAGVGMLQLNLLSTLSPTEGRTMAMAVHWTLVGFVSAVGPIAGGWVKDYFSVHPIDFPLYAGTAFSYFQLLILLHGIMIWFMMLPLLLQIQKQEGEWPIQRAVADIFILTPLRSVRNIYSYNLAAVNYGKAVVKKNRTQRNS